jgi:hypothetical protein
MSTHFDSMDFGHQLPSSGGRVDLDGMTVLPDLTPTVTSSNMGLSLDLDPVSEHPEEGNMLDAPDSPATAAWAPFISEIFGSNWRCPSPVVLHFGDTPQSPEPSANNALCPIWKKSNELFGKVFQHRPGTATLNVDSIEAGLLYLGIKQGWDTFNEWSQSPALKILKEVDQFLFAHLPRMERLAAAYKSFKLLKVCIA